MSVATAPSPTQTLDLVALAAQVSARFPDAVALDKPDKPTALVVSPAKLAEVATYLRDTPGFKFNYLANVTSVDWPDRFEVIYHLASVPRGGALLQLRVNLTDKANPVVPTLYHVYPGADLQEREVWDLMGIKFAGHPDLRRILLWDGFQGHPLRKDWHEAYYEQDAKPFDSRWPGAEHVRAETKNRWGDNIAYPPDFQPAGFEPIPEPWPVLEAEHLQASGPLKTERIIINMGPQHPSTHGVFRMVVTLDGETIVDLKPVVGYLHRNHEKIGERNTWLMNMPYTDRLDYITSMSNNLGYALAVEKLLGLRPPERAEYIRVIMAEFTRIVSHCFALGSFINDLGAFYTPFLYLIEERELILDLFEMASGSRMMCNYMRFGGVARDLPEEFLPIARDLVNNRLPKAIDQFDRLVSTNEIVTARCQGVGVLPYDKAIAFSTAGPVLRASGVAYDLRRHAPYSIYDRFDFDIATRPEGDVYARYLVRLQEMRQSVKILQQALQQIPDGEIQLGKKDWKTKVPAGDAYGRIENPKGELGFYLVSDGGPNPYRYHVRAPCFINLTVLGELCKGHKVADVVAILGSIDIVLGEVDR